MATTFMGLNLAGVLTTKGPDYATLINQAFTSLDSHDHSSGRGTPITPAGLNINADLSLANNNLTSARSLRLTSQSAVLTLPADAIALYAKAGDLFYNNSANVAVQVTSGNGLNAAAAGGISGDFSTSSASVNYTASTTLFSFFSAPSTYANLSIGSITLNPTTSGGTSTSLSFAITGRTVTQTLNATRFAIADAALSDLLVYTPATPSLRIGQYVSGAGSTMPTGVGTQAIAQDLRAPLQISTHGAATEAYVTANKEAALGLGLGYANATPGGSGTLAVTGGLLRMFVSDPLYFANQTVIGGVMGSDGRWGFSGGGLTAPTTTARVQVLASASEDALRLDGPGAAATGVAIASGGTTAWRISAQASGPLTLTDVSASGQVLSAPGLKVNGGFTQQGGNLSFPAQTAIAYTSTNLYRALGSPPAGQFVYNGGTLQISFSSSSSASVAIPVGAPGDTSVVSVSLSFVYSGAAANFQLTFTSPGNTDVTGSASYASSASTQTLSLATVNRSISAATGAGYLIFTITGASSTLTINPVQINYGAITHYPISVSL